MGLKLLRHRADLIGAAIRFEPRRPRGTTIVCSLPERHEKQNAPATEAMTRARRPAAPTAS
jgi:hypothetical protein